MRGRKPKPAAVALKQGNPRKQRARPDTAPDPTKPDTDSRIVQRTQPVPDFLSPSATRVWHVLADELAANRITRQTDTLTLARYCELFGLWLDLRANLVGKSKTGKVRTTHRVQDKDGRYIDRARPEFAHWMKTATELRQLEDRMALNPAYRAQLMSRMADASRAPPPPTQQAADPSTGTLAPGSPIGAVSSSRVKH